MIYLDEKLKNRIKVGLIFGAIALVALSNIWFFVIFLLVLYSVSFYEIWLVLGERIENKLLLCIATFFLSIYLVPAIFTAYYLRRFFFIGLFLAILSMVINDSMALFTGKKFGKHKIAPKTSPKKTWEGAIGGFLGTIFLLPIIGLLFNFDFYWYLEILSLSIILVPLGVAGDFAESWFKRRCGVKNSSFLLGEHGGLLDRLDSHLWVIPVAFFYFWYLGYIQLF